MSVMCNELPLDTGSTTANADCLRCDGTLGGLLVSPTGTAPITSRVGCTDYPALHAELADARTVHVTSDLAALPLYVAVL